MDARSEDPPLLQVIVPAYNEHANIRHLLKILDEESPANTEILIVVDDALDNTIGAAKSITVNRIRVSVIINETGGGPANAIKYGLSKATADYLVVMMADGSDDAATLAPMVHALSRGAALVCASRYMKGGQQIGGPLLKSFLSRIAGLSFNILARVDTHDVTNCYKGYRREFIQQARLHSSKGFEVGLETVVRAIEQGAVITEVPTIWRDRAVGESRFKLAKWLPLYLRWYCKALWAARLAHRRDKSDSI